MKSIWLLVAAAALMFGGTQASLARVDGPWCFHMQLGKGFVSSRCDMPTYEACRAEMHSMSGTYCTENPYYWWNARNAQPKPKAKRRIRH